MLFKLHGKRPNYKGKDIKHDDSDPSVFAIGISLIAGPGAIASIILLTNAVHGNAWWVVSIFCVMLIVNLVVVVVFKMAELIGRVLGTIAISVVNILFGTFLAALAIQFIFKGLTNFDLAINYYALTVKAKETYYERYNC